MFGRLKRILSKIKRLNTSIEEYKSNSIVQSLPVVAYLNQAKKLLDDKKYNEAEKILLHALEIETKNALIYKYLGKIYEHNFDLGKAIINYEKSTKINSQDKEIWLRLGFCQLNTNNLDQALESFDKANKITPYNTDVYTGWGMTYMQLKNYAMARDKFNIASQINKYNYTAILLSAVMETRLGEYVSAEAKLRFLTQTVPNESSMYEYANLQFNMQHYDLAIEYAQKAIHINKNLLPAYILIGDIYSIQGNSEKSDEQYDLALQQGLDSIVLHMEYGNSNLRLLKIEKAENEFNEVLSKDSENKIAKTAIVLLKAYKNDFSQIDEYRNQYSTLPYIKEAIGLEYIYNKEFEKAVEIFQAMIKEIPLQYENFIFIARAYKGLNNIDKSKEYYDKFLEIIPDNICIWIEYSLYLQEINDYASAQRKLRKALKIEQDNIDILNLLFIVSYKLVKENVCEYNIKEVLDIADKAIKSGEFRYTNEKLELENILSGLQGNN